MTDNITWLHLSDWHQRGEEFDRTAVRDALLRDIQEQADKISPDPGRIDFIVFSGDAAFSGKEEEYRAAAANLFDPVLKACGLTGERLLIVPGNHDLNMDDFYLLPEPVKKPLTDEKTVQKWLADGKGRERLLDPFEAYNRFIGKYPGEEQSAYLNIRQFKAGSKKIGLLGLNSAWMCGRKKDANGEPDDYGALIIGEPQIVDGLNKISAADVRIAVMHHSFDWLAEFDRSRVEERLGKECHFILCGHQHMAQVKIITGTPGDCVTIPAGACFDRRTAADPRYTNAYNFVRLNFSTGQGTVYLRRWSDRQGAWLADTDTMPEGNLSFSLPKMAKLSVPPAAATREKEADPIVETWLRAWYRHVAAGCRHLPLEVIDPKLLEQEENGALNLDEVYVGLDVFHRPPRQKQSQQIEQESDKRQAALELLDQEKRLVLLGDPGSGKTTFVNYLTGALALAAADSLELSALPKALHGLMPVRLVLREAAHGDKKSGAALLWKAVEEDIAMTGCPPEIAARTLAHLQERIRGQGALFFLDGLDEVPESEGRRKNLLKAVRDLADTCPPGCRFLITARPYAYAKPATRLADFSTAELAPLNEEQRKRFIERWYEAMRKHTRMNRETTRAKAESLQTAVLRPNLAELASRPLLLTLMAALHTGRGRLPEDRARLYNDSVELLLGDWQRSRQVRGPDGRPVAEAGMLQVLESDLGEVRKAMEKLAFQVHERQRREQSGTDAPADIRKGEVLEAFDPLLNRGELRSRQLLEYLDRQAGLLIAREEGGPYAFPHRSFQEYLAACRVCNLPDYLDRFRKLAEQDPAWWREVFLLGTGRLCESSAGLVTHMVNALLPRDTAKVKKPTDKEWRKAALAGEALLEQFILDHLQEDDAYVEVYEKIRDWLARCLKEGRLPPRERAAAGEVLGRLGDPRPGIGLDKNGLPDIVWADIPGGEFWMGSEDGRNNERPCHQLRLDAFRIARYPVTVAQYRAFMDAGGYDEERWWTKPGWAWRTGELDKWKDAKEYALLLEHRSVKTRGQPWNWPNQQRFFNYPVRSVTWFEAAAFCCWLGAQLDADIRLPAEAQWERAAAGRDGRKFPWGDAEWDEQRANLKKSGINHPVAAGLYPAGATPEKVLDLAGNLWEWCLSLYKKYPCQEEDGRNDLETKGYRILRGGVYYIDKSRARCTYRNRYLPDSYYEHVGFRVVMSPANSES
ncbi:MAG: SUMF1/EgtB/PvdO family nonheme iron enzyme [Gammaproteobacteria bacterium]|nr:SUMF1/EgtB/PvdO family nonheme iron enzyme [Gammaproteobacteria bacterium]